MASEPFISVVIPALNEADQLASTLEDIARVSSVEVVVVDGGSTDGTPRLAAAWGAKVLATPAGRAKQMNAGAAAARGGVLLFLHADTRLPREFDHEIIRAIDRPGVAAGAFRLRFNGRPSALMKVIECTANWRARYLQMPFGDQGIFLRKGLFIAMGGFLEIQIMEDVEFVRRLKRRGRIVIVPSPVVTAARRYEAAGTFKRMLVNKVAFVSYHLGVPPRRIARLYDR